MRSLSIALFVVVSLCWQSAMAQASSPGSPEQKKPEATAASSPVLLARGAAPAPPAAASSAKTVAERKAETIDAAKKGQLVPAGHGSPAQVQ